jgi:5-(carboxyamino)imidazole ribonucleotide synthase
MTALAPGATLGILGGGQLGRMLAMAAARLGYRTHVFEPGPAPAADVSHAWTLASYGDEAALTRFADAVDAVTYEFENIPPSALDLLEARRPVRPGRRALETSGDRLTEKRFLIGLGLATAPFAPVDDTASLAAALEEIGTPARLKTRRLGYDGKGQARLDAPEDADAALAAMEGAPALLEGHVAFSAEISVIVARSLSGEVVAYDPGLNRHEAGILRETRVPAPLAARVLQDAVLVAGRIATALDYVGVMGVELFVAPEGLLVNEIAPRVHNSGHWTQLGCAVDQFETHVRAVTGHPLGDGSRHADVVMENLIGGDVDRVPALLGEPGAQVHLYGKGEARPGRKMGHVNRIVRRP